MRPPTSHLAALVRRRGPRFFSSAADRFRTALLHASDGLQALQILHEWDSALAGDLEGAPRRSDYHAVLRRLPSEAAREVVQVLKDSYDMQPTWETYAAAVACGYVDEEGVKVLLEQQPDTLATWIALSDLIRMEDERWSRLAVKRWTRFFLRQPDLSLDSFIRHDPRRFLSEEAMRYWDGLLLSVCRLQTNGTRLLRILEQAEARKLPTRHEHYAVATKTTESMEILDRLHQRHKRVLPQVTLEDWNCLLEASYHVGRYQDIVRIYKHMNSKKLLRNTQTLSIVFRALAQQGTGPAALLASSILRKAGSRATASHYTSTLLAWSRSRHPNAVDESEQVWEMLLDAGLQPNPMQYSALLATLGYSDDPEAVSKILILHKELRERRFVLDSSAHVAVFKALAKSGHGAQEAEWLLDDLSPDAMCHAWAMKAWVNAKAPDVLERCAKIVERLEKEYEQSNGNEALRPNRHVYAALISAYFEADPATGYERAMAILDSQEEAHRQGSAAATDVAFYTEVITTIWKSNQPDAVAHAQAVYRRMYDAFQSGILDAKPDAHAATALILTWARSDRADRIAEVWRIFSEMKDAYEDNGDVNMRPNLYTLGAVLNACSHFKPSTLDEEERTVGVAIRAFTSVDSDLGGADYAQLFRCLGYVILDLRRRVGVFEPIFRSKFQRSASDVHASGVRLSLMHIQNVVTRAE